MRRLFFYFLFCTHFSFRTISFFNAVLWSACVLVIMCFSVVRRSRVDRSRIVEEGLGLRIWLYESTKPIIRPTMNPIPSGNIPMRIRQICVMKDDKLGSGTTEAFSGSLSNRSKCSTPEKSMERGSSSSTDYDTGLRSRRSWVQIPAGPPIDSPSIH